MMNCLIMVLELIVYLILNQHHQVLCYYRMQDPKTTVLQTLFLLKRPVIASLAINVQLTVGLSIPARPFKILLKSVIASRKKHMKAFLCKAQQAVKLLGLRFKSGANHNFHLMIKETVSMSIL